MKAILACERNGGIGHRGTMPWPKQDKDLARFKELTLNTTIIMGSGTWEATGMPKPLPNRKNVVVSTTLGIDDLPPGVGCVSDISPENLALIDPPVEWCIGGAQLIGSLWNQIDELHLTHLFAEYECDTTIDLASVKEEFYCARSQLNLTHTYEIWKRK